MTRTSAGSVDAGGYPTPAVSMARLFRDRVAATPDVEAFRFPTELGWESVTWAQVDQTVKTMAAGLLALGVRAEDRVAIVSNTRIEWVHADLAVMCAGGATTTVYPTTGAEGVGFIVSDSGSRIVFAEDDAQIDKLRQRREHLLDVDRVVTFDGTADGEWVLGSRDLLALGAKHLEEHPTAVDESVAAVQPEHLATLIYTSGTTGQPKGVELAHRCWTYIAAGATTLDLLSSEDLQYLWLPLAHAFGKMLEAVQLQVGFPTAIDGRVDKIVENLAVVQPTFMAGPPRIFEKVHAKVMQTIDEEGGLRRQLFTWAFGVGDRAAQARLEQHRPAPLVRRSSSSPTGSCSPGSGPARRPDPVPGLRQRGAVGRRGPVVPRRRLPILEGYALTETSSGAASAVSTSCGSGGRTTAGRHRVKVADDGEIFIRGPGVMDGYHHLPHVTAEVLSKDGWFATGDIGEIDDQGRLRITDRKKDLAKTTGGKYIAPQAIEATFKAVCPLASEMIVHADGRNYATALITLDAEALTQWDARRPVLDRLRRACGGSRRPRLRGFLRRCAQQPPEPLETIKDFRILDHDLTVDDEELTPSMKSGARSSSRVQAAVDSMYDEQRHG